MRISSLLRDTVRREVQRRKQAAANPPPTPLELIACIPSGCEKADYDPLGVSLNADASVATYVYEGAVPDPAVLASLKTRLCPWGMTVVSHRPD